MEYQHESLADGRWFNFLFVEQMGNIGSEISRAARAIDNDKRWQAVTRAFELLDLTIADPRWRPRLKELLRVREVIGDAVLGGSDYQSNFEDLDHYFLPFALAARSHL